ncbi:hypothetical protein B0A49_00478 [Cryomyces minteri]|uniref:2EXR domain-containing protein n=1 Tax=Cryomyces minteri TaxID=331657 RepID=A0A4U0Y1Q6_9PEZI|nr:hypothetical protein B0A49_00478 [Cryomyces minteri]
MSGEFLATVRSESRITPFGETVTRFRHVATWDSWQRLPVNPVTLKDGSFKGRQVIFLDLMAPVKPFPFESLPAEIRNKIYLLTLRYDNLIISRSKRRERLKRNKEKLRGLDQRAPLALLQVNKAIREEASSVFYGFNTFQMDTTKTLLHFLEFIGDHRRFLSNIVLAGTSGYDTKAPEALNLLADATHLRRLLFYQGVKAHGIGWHDFARTIHRDCGRLIAATDRTRQENAGPGSVIDFRFQDYGFVCGIHREYQAHNEPVENFLAVARTGVATGATSNTVPAATSSSDAVV